MNSTFSVKQSVGKIRNTTFPSAETTDNIVSTSRSDHIGTEDIHRHSVCGLRPEENIELVKDLECSSSVNTSEKKNPVDYYGKLNEFGNKVSYAFELKGIDAKDNPSNGDRDLKDGRYVIKSKTDSNIAENTVSKDLGFPCLTCGIIASKEKTSRKHKTAHESGFRCTFCPQVFFTEHIARSHQSLHRRGDLQFVDDICQCKLCGGSFMSLLYLEFHLYEIHGEIILMNPKVVHLGSSYMDDSDNHCDYEEEEKKPFRCGNCNSLFQHSLNLDCHMVFHDKDLFACATCEATFSMLDSLLIHSKIHVGSKSLARYESYKGNTKFSIMASEHNGNNTRNTLNIRRQIPASSYKEMNLGCYKEKSVNFFPMMVTNTKSLETQCIYNRKFLAPASQYAKNSGFPSNTNFKTNNFLNPQMFHFLPDGKYHKNN